MTTRKQLVFRIAPSMAIQYGADTLPGINKPKFDLFALLALKRVEGEFKSFVDAEEILELASWGKNKAESVGKQISAYIGQRLRPIGLNGLIEAEQVTKGPYRLAVSANSIDLGMSLEGWRDRLGQRSPMGNLTPARLKSFYSFVENIWQGSQSFNEGKVKDARRFYQRAVQASVFPHHTVLALYNHARALDRLGDAAAAEKAMTDALNLLPEVKQDVVWASAKIYSMKGWLALRGGNSEEANRFYARAHSFTPTRRNHQIESVIHNGLGLIAQRNAQDHRALVLYYQALECGVLAEDFYTIQASYFNIGKLFSFRADALRRAHRREAALDLYRDSSRWTKACRQLCDKLAIGEDSNDDRILLSHIYRHLGKLDAALTVAQEALHMAQRASNQRCLAFAYRELAAIEITRGNVPAASELIAEARRAVDRSALPYLGEERLKQAIASMRTEVF